IISNGKGSVAGLECVKMELGEPDASGRRSPKALDGSNFVLDVDTVIMSIGTSPNPLIRTTTSGLEANRHGCLVVNEEMMTTKEGVYAGGDAVTGAATVILAMGAGKTAARAINDFIIKK
ncbi:MAG: FAD-dependent oxidoreductase, partial [Oscillospiraceae bacterium]